jgi:hypothetical protein
MTDRLLSPALAICLLSASAPAAAGFETGAVLAGLCHQPTAICLAYLEGVVDGAEAMGWEQVVSGICIPEQVDSMQLRQIFLEYAERRDELLKMPAGLLVLDALKQAWPCQP